jgi:hypothetical protein
MSPGSEVGPNNGESVEASAAEVMVSSFPLAFGFAGSEDKRGSTGLDMVRCYHAGSVASPILSTRFSPLTVARSCDPEA